MNYGQFLNMIPEATLMAILIVVFIADFALKNNGKKHEVLYGFTGLLLFAQLVPCALAEPAAAAGCHLYRISGLPPAGGDRMHRL